MTENFGVSFFIDLRDRCKDPVLLADSEDVSRHLKRAARALKSG